MNRHKEARRNRIVVSETKIGPTVIRRQFAPINLVYGLIADAIASERNRAKDTPIGASTMSATTPNASRNGTSPRKSNGHAKALAPTKPSLRDTFFRYDDASAPSHRNPSTRPNRQPGEWDDSYSNIPERSWKRYRAMQWRGGGNRWSYRHSEAFASE